MGERSFKTYEFGEFRLKTDDGTLWCGGERLAVTQKVVEMLTLLLENRGRVVTRDEILECLWPGTYVDENNLAVTVSMLRKALGESANVAKLIETIPRKGYRFNGDVRLSTSEIIVAESEYERAVIETTQIDDEGASRAIAQLQTRSNRQRAVLMFVAAGLLILAGSLGWSYVNGRGPFSPPPVYSVAVMPLKDLSGEDNGRQLSIGIADSLITKLSSVRGLSVRPMSSVTPYVDKDVSAIDVGRELTVDAILEGTIQRFGENYRISVQVVNVKDNQVMWANVLEQNSASIFEFQRAISAQVTDALAFKISEQDRRRMTGKPTENAEAYREQLIGRFFFNKRTPEDLRKAIPHFERAIELDPAFSDPLAGLAATYMLLSDSGFGDIPPAEGYPKAESFARMALRLDESQAEAHAVLGYVETGYGWDPVSGEKQLRRAIELSPSLASAHLWLGWNLIMQQRFYEANDALARAAELDPTSLTVLSDLGYPAFFSGDYDRATELFRRAIERDRNYAAARFNLWRSLFYGGRYDEASAELDAISTLLPSDTPVLMMARGCTLVRQGKHSEARQLYYKLRERQRAGEFITPNFTATLAAELNETDGFFTDLETFLKERNDYLPYLKFAPEFRQYHDDPRFQDVLSRAGLGG